MNRFPFPPYHSGIPHWSERVVTYCAKVLPLVFDNSLSYYEFLGHVQSKLNQVIEALNNQNLVFVEFTHMIELELQNFEKYMDERQSNFEQSMQDEWTAFKADMEEAWGAFKTQMEEAWAAEQELNEQFRTDMQAAFTQFQTTIQQQHTAFETLMQQRQSTFETSLQAQQNQFQTDMVSRQNTFEDTMEDNFEDWKVDTLAALQAGIQQFETDALAAIRADLPDLIEDVVGEEIIEPVVKREVARNGFAKILSAANQTAGAALDLTSVPLSIYDGGVLRDDGLTVADLANVEIKPNTSIVFTSQLLWRNVGNIRALVSDAAFPASGWTLQIGKYTTQQAISSTFDVSNFTELVSSPISDSSTAYYANSNAGIDAGIGYYQYVCIRFVADPTESSFTCDYSAGVELDEPQTADLVVQSEINGNKYKIPKYVVDDALSSTSTNPVQNKVVQAPVARLVDAGVKNIAAVRAAPSRSDIDIQVVDGHVSISGTLTSTITWQVSIFDFVCKTDMVVIGAITQSNIAYNCRYIDGEGNGHYEPIPTGGILTIPAGSTINYLYLQGNVTGQYVSIDVDVMLCTAEDYAISPEFVPYAPSNRELYEMILALQNP